MSLYNFAKICILRSVSRKAFSTFRIGQGSFLKLQFWRTFNKVSGIGQENPRNPLSTFHAQTFNTVNWVTKLSEKTEGLKRRLGWSYPKTRKYRKEDLTAISGGHGYLKLDTLGCCKSIMISLAITAGVSQGTPRNYNCSRKGWEVKWVWAGSSLQTQHQSLPFAKPTKILLPKDCILSHVSDIQVSNSTDYQKFPVKTPIV